MTNINNNNIDRNLMPKVGKLVFFLKLMWCVQEGNQKMLSGTASCIDLCVFFIFVVSCRVRGCVWSCGHPCTALHWYTHDPSYDTVWGLCFGTCPHGALVAQTWAGWWGRSSGCRSAPRRSPPPPLAAVFLCGAYSSAASRLPTSSRNGLTF